MKKLSTYLFLILFSFSAPSFADDIRDFQIEGISIGDSLLDYMSEEEIKIQLERNKEMYSYTDKKFIGIRVYGGSFEVYEYIAATIKRTSDPNYKIYSIRGMFDYSNPADCLKKQKAIVKDLSLIFENTKKNEWNRSSAADPTGQSKIIGVSFEFEEGGDVSVTCYDYAKHVNRASGLDVSVRNKEFNQWLDKY